MVLIVLVFMGLTFFGTVNAANAPGPAPNSGDGIPDGSGVGFPPGPFGPFDD